MRRAGSLREEGRSLSEIARVLNRERVPTLSGLDAWTSSSVQYALARLRTEQMRR
ncbi:MAG TPA: recombinase family protein [Pilimelia sp.]|nr:recombinase family protein [Pilimelia sp.]